MFQLWRELFNAKRILQDLQDQRYALGVEMTTAMNSLDNLKRNCDSARNELSLLLSQIASATMDADQAKAVRRKIFDDARKAAEQLTKGLIAQGAQRGHKIAREIITEAEETSDKIMAGAENYAEFLKARVPKE